MARSNYEATHPVLSVRVSQEIYDQLQEQRQHGRSYGDILRLGLGKQEAYDAGLLKRIEELELRELQLEEENLRLRQQLNRR